MFAFYPTLMVGWEWFPERKGFVTGLIVAAQGISAFFWGFLSTYLVNPESVKPIDIGKEKYFEKEIADRVPSMYSKLVCIWLFLYIIAITLISRPSKIEEKN